jgi:hypothetical protein
MQTFNEHFPTSQTRQRVKDLIVCGVSQENTANIIGICVETLQKHYKRELNTALDEMITRVGTKALELAEQGNDKMIGLVLKTRGASRGWVEKQVIETIDSKETEELKASIAKLEAEHIKDY